MPSVPHPSQWSDELLRILRTAGLLDDPAWHKAFTAVPRHHFLPYFYSAMSNTWHRLDPDSVGDDAWCRLAYRDQTWVMRLSGPHSQPGHPASSSIQPSLAVRMLNELAVTNNSHILEIGTGTGYLTALLCHRVGANNITSIDIDPELVDSAGRLLAELGYTPTLVTADAILGYPDQAPYDRVLGTAAVDRIPDSWIDQTRPGGRIVTPLRSTIAIIDVHDDHHATGRFLPIVVKVLPLRTQVRIPLAGSSCPHITSGRSVDHGSLPVRALYDDNFRFLLDIALPGINVDEQDPLGGLVVRDADGSTAQISPAGQARQLGPRRLCDDIATIHKIWHTAGEPGSDRYRLTIDSRRHTIWLDDGREWHWVL
ncbi:MAG: methyltransferase domain-containing protein [Pseudonocardiaceae bacterium]